MLNLLLTLLLATTAAAAPKTQVFVAEGTLVYQGSITADANLRLQSLYAAQSPKPTRLRIRSTGGEINQGMDLGDWIQAERLEVEVENYCLSSCANYVFSAGRRKLLGKHAILAFHGGAASAQFDTSELEAQLAKLPEAERKAILETVQNQLALDRQRESSYFARLGVSPLMVTLGQGPEYAQYNSQPQYWGWFFSSEDLRKLGLKDVVELNPPWEPPTELSGRHFFQARP